MRRLILGLVACVLVGATTGCFDQKAVIRKLVPKEEDQFSRHFIETVRQGKFAEGTKMLDGSVSTDAAFRGLSELHGLLDHGEVIGIEPMSFFIFKSTGGDTGSGPPSYVQLEYQVQFKDSWLAGRIVLVGSGTSLKVNTARFQPLPDSLEKINAFSLEGRGWKHFAVLLMTVLVLLLCLITLVCCFRSELRPKWLWAIFIALPIGSFHLNWASGETSYQAISVSLFGATMLRGSPFMPWTISFGLPVGAVVFWIKHLELRRAVRHNAPKPLH